MPNPIMKIPFAGSSNTLLHLGFNVPIIHIRRRYRYLI